MPISTQVIAIIIFFSPIFLPTYTMEMENKETSNFYSIYLPALGTACSESFRENGLTNVDERIYKTLGFEKKDEPKFFYIDLGQGNCVRHFKEQLEKDPNAQDKKLLLSGTSQGAGTISNYVASLTPEKQKNIRCLILESPLGSGNSAIMHVSEISLDLIFPEQPIFRYAKYLRAAYLPGARLWLPWCGKIFFPTYNPWGIQAISSAKKIATSILVIIMHHIQDMQLSVNDARRLYCAFRQAGNNNAYLFEFNNRVDMDADSNPHFDILNTDTPEEKIKKIGAIQLIYQKYQLPYNKKLLKKAKKLHDTIDLEEFQPSIKEVKERINQSTWKARYVRNTIDLVTFGAVGFYVAYKYLYKNPAFLALLKQ